MQIPNNAIGIRKAYHLHCVCKLKFKENENEKNQIKR